MEYVHAGFFCLLHDIEVDLIEVKICAGTSATCSRSRGRRCSGGCRSRSRSSFRNRAELCDEVGDINDILCLTVADAVDHLLEGIQTLEQRVHNVLVELELLLADEIKHVFHLVRQLCNLGKAHRCGHPFECMCVAEDVVDGADLLHVLFEAQKAFIERLQVLVRLIQEHVHILVIH